jgi:hypothetical protein
MLPYFYLITIPGHPGHKQILGHDTMGLGSLVWESHSFRSYAP